MLWGLPTGHTKPGCRGSSGYPIDSMASAAGVSLMLTPVWTVVPSRFDRLDEGLLENQARRPCPSPPLIGASLGVGDTVGVQVGFGRLGREMLSHRTAPRPPRRSR